MAFKMGNYSKKMAFIEKWSFEVVLVLLCIAYWACWVVYRD